MQNRKPDSTRCKVIHLPGYDRAHPEEVVDLTRPTRTPESRLAATLRLARADGHEVALLVLRVSEFRELAENFGPRCGELLSSEIRQRLDRCMRGSDRVFALGEGEFAVVLPQAESPEDVDTICNRLVQACDGRYELEEVAPCVSTSIGVATYPTDAADVDDLLRFAHVALRRAEASSQGAVRHFSRELLNRQRFNAWMEAELERALAEQRFILHYQPQYALDSHEIVSMEALVRLQTVEGEVIQPGDFITIAEGNSFIVKLGHWVIGEACRQLARWRRAGPAPRRIAVNVSSRQLLDPSLPQAIDQAIDECGLRHHDLELEITESCALEYLPVAGNVLQQLHDRGVRIAIDDFGVGYSSFAMLAQLPLDIFKLDRTFLATIASGPRGRHVMTAMIAMARELGYQVVAEGVETAEQHRFLQASGCDLGQGFGLARPQDAQTISRLLLAAEEVAQAV